jgi:hypothetical protein
LNRTNCLAHTNFDDLFVCCVILKSLKFQATLGFFSKIKKWTFHSDCVFRSIFLYLSKVIFKISCIILYNIDLHNCEQIFTHLHLNLSGKAFKVGVQHFSSVSDTLNGLKYMRIKTKNLNRKRPSRHYVGRIVTFTFLADFVRFPCMRFREMPENLINL